MRGARCTGPNGAKGVQGSVWGRDQADLHGQREEDVPALEREAHLDGAGETLGEGAAQKTGGVHPEQKH